MVSLFCLPGDDAIDAFELAHNAGLFGLFIFASVGIFAESGGRTRFSGDVLV